MIRFRNPNSTHRSTRSRVIRAVIAVAIAVLVVLASVLAIRAMNRNGGQADPDSACQAAHSRIRALSAEGSQARAALAAVQAADALRSLNLAISASTSLSPDPEAIINLRFATSIVAQAVADAGDLIASPGSGLPGEITDLGDEAFAQIQAASTGLQAPDCGAAMLGQSLFRQLMARVTAPTGPNLRQAADAACQDIETSYGTNQIAVDAPAATAQLRRSVAVLQAGLEKLADVRNAAGTGLRRKIRAASVLLEIAAAHVGAGAPPAEASVAAFTAADPILVEAFSSIGVRCRIPGP